MSRLAPLIPVLAPVLVLLGLAAAPFAGLESGFAHTLMARVCILGTAALGLSLLVGGAGLVSLGQAATVGVGAYAVAALDHWGVTEGLVVFPAAAAAAGLFALLTGAVSLRTSGVYFIMITLAFGQMLFFAASSLSVLGGDDGYTLFGRTPVAGTRLLAGRTGFHFACLAMLAATWLLWSAVAASRFGRVLRAAKENPARTEAMGFDPYPFRLLAYTAVGAVGGLAGAMLANATEFVSPAALGWGRSAELLFMVILGGAGRLGGAVLGALAIVLLEEWLSGLLPYWRLAFGPLLVLSVLVLPGGLAGIGPPAPRPHA